MSRKRRSTRTGREFSKAEALDILAETRLLQMAINELNKKALRALRKPDLRVIDGGKKRQQN